MLDISESQSPPVFWPIDYKEVRQLEAVNKLARIMFPRCSVGVRQTVPMGRVTVVPACVITSTEVEYAD